MNVETSRVLIVDDDWTLRNQLAKAVNSVGLPCDCANDGAEALNKYERHNHRLVVTDLRMPERNGHALAVDLLSRPNPPVIVVLTAVTEPRLAVDLRLRGVYDVIYKPLNLWRFADQIRSILQSDPEGNINPSTTDEMEERRLATKERTSNERLQLERLFEQNESRYPWATVALKWFDWRLLPEIPPCVVDAVLRRLNEQTNDIRKDVRVAILETGVVMPLSDLLQPIGQPFKVIVRDLTPSGVGIAHSQAIEWPCIALTWKRLDRAPAIFIGKVKRCQQLSEYVDIHVTVYE